MYERGFYNYTVLKFRKVDIIIAIYHDISIFQYIDTLIISIDITLQLSVMRCIDMLTYCCSSTEASFEGSAENLAAMQPDMLRVYGTCERVYIKLHALPPPLQQ